MSEPLNRSEALTRIAELEQRLGESTGRIETDGRLIEELKDQLASEKNQLATEKIRTRIAITAERQDCSNILYTAYEQIMARSKSKP